MKNILNKTEVIRFIITGVISVAIDFSVYQLLCSLSIPRAVAKFASFFLGAVVGFAINKLWTFGSNKALAKEIPRYVLLYASTALINATVNAVVLRLSAILLFTQIMDGLALDSDITVTFAFLCATGVSMVLNFLGLKLFVFGKIQAKDETVAKKFSVVIPCYNERDNLPLILERFEKVLSGQNLDAEVILVDNGSSDGSDEIINELLPKYTFAETVRVEVNQGYGYGILFGLKAANGDYIGWTHADLQTDPADVIKAFVLAKDNSTPLYIKGRRKGRSFFDVFFTFGMSCFETLILHKPLFDINAQPNIFPRSFYESWNNPPYDFSLDLYAYYMALKSGLTVERFPVQFPPRIYGESHWNTGLTAKWKFIKRTVDFSFKLKKSMRG